MGEFKKFIQFVKEHGDIWKSEDVYFTQTRNCYIADYRSDYPNQNKKDETIILNHINGE